MNFLTNQEFISRDVIINEDAFPYHSDSYTKYMQPVPPSMPRLTPLATDDYINSEIPAIDDYINSEEVHSPSAQQNNSNSDENSTFTIPNSCC